MKIRVEVTDDAGEKTALEKEGSGTAWKNRVVQEILEFIQKVFGMFATSPTEEAALLSDGRYREMTGGRKGELTLMERVESLIKFEHPGEWRTSIDVKKMYEQNYHERINMSTVSTYLSRMYRDGKVERRGNRRQREYRITDTAKSAVDRALSQIKSQTDVENK
jgi:chromosome condensin MukBEF ATPase and DNA-binding subunit MukB